MGGGNEPRLDGGRTLVGSGLCGEALLAEDPGRESDAPARAGEVECGGNGGVISAALPCGKGERDSRL